MTGSDVEAQKMSPAKPSPACGLTRKTWMILTGAIVAIAIVVIVPIVVVKKRSYAPVAVTQASDMGEVALSPPSLLRTTTIDAEISDGGIIPADLKIESREVLTTGEKRFYITFDVPDGALNLESNGKAEGYLIAEAVDLDSSTSIALIEINDATTILGPFAIVQGNSTASVSRLLDDFVLEEWSGGVIVLRTQNGTAEEDAELQVVTTFLFDSAVPTLAEPETVLTADLAQRQVSRYQASGTMNIVRRNVLQDDGEVGVVYDAVFVNVMSPRAPDPFLYISGTEGATDVDNAEIILLDDTQNGWFSKDGSFTFELPSTFDPEMAKSVVLWCKKYGVHLSSADFAAPSPEV